MKQFAEAEKGDLLGALGIDWTALILQMISFVILVIIVAKFIYPPILAMLDRQEQKIKNAEKAAAEAQANAEKSEAESAALLEKSRDEAAEILEAARVESAEILGQAEKDAAEKADAMVMEARAGIERDVEQARQELRREMVDLVGLATEKVVGDKLKKEDEKIIRSALKELE